MYVAEGKPLRKKECDHCGHANMFCYVHDSYSQWWWVTMHMQYIHVVHFLLGVYMQSVSLLPCYEGNQSCFQIGIMPKNGQITNHLCLGRKKVFLQQHGIVSGHA